jgi:cell fate (sporulation/competence/biofilm development) regulator YlbF (YheA/YmcA/DUF963 family)
MPIWLRNFTFNQIKEFKEAQQSGDTESGEETVKNIKEAQSTVKVPDYVSRVSKK